MRERFHPSYRRLGPAQTPLPGISDRQFEQLVYESIARDVNSRAAQSGCRVVLTQRSADRGRDIVVSDFAQRKLLGFTYEQPPDRIIVECKLTGRQRLNFEHFASNLLQTEPAKSSVFLLVTNATLTPRSLSLAEEHCSRLGLRFQLIDSLNIRRHLPWLFSEAVRSVTSGNRPETPDRANLQISYQVLPPPEPSSSVYTLHLVVRSFDETSVTVGAALHSTRTWTDASEAIHQPKQLTGDSFACFTLALRPRKATVKRAATLALSIDGKPELFNVTIAGADNTIELPLFGSLAEAIDEYLSQLYADTAPFILHLYGQSGTGKTRFIREVADRLTPQRVLWFRLRSDGTAIRVRPEQRAGASQKVEKVSQAKMLTAIAGELESDSACRVVFLDDLHVASNETLNAVERMAFRPSDRVRLILAGRSDAPIRAPRYQALAHLLRRHGGPLHREMTFANLDGLEIANIVSSLIAGQLPEAMAGVSGASGVRAIELVHYVHSLLERGFIYWKDENTLALQSRRLETLNEGPLTPSLAADVLNLRLDFLDGIRVGDAILTDVFAVTALLDIPKVTAEVLRVLRSDYLISSELLLYWFDEDEAAGLAFTSHDTIAEQLRKRCYRFSQNRNLRSVVEQFTMLERELNPEQRAIISLHEGDFGAAVPAMAAVARHLRCAKNITSLPLDDGIYDILNALIFCIKNKSRRYPSILLRAITARAYLNMHCREFVEGLLDCVELLAQTQELPENQASRRLRVVVYQVIAHGLLNSGDLRTALSLMHEVEELLRETGDSRITCAVEFDMCDRLQSYYTQQSAFNLARRFFFRGRSCAHRSGDQTLVSVSLSGEFHLFRYLNAARSVEHALQQVRHSREHALPRQQFHAQVNYLSAEWARSGGPAPSDLLERLKKIQSECQRHGYSHLVPRVDYLIALDALLRYEEGSGVSKDVKLLIEGTRLSALRYGYGEYVRLADNLELLWLISAGEDRREITTHAQRLVQDLERDGWTFIAGDHLCYHNVVTLSNAVRAIYNYSDENSAWRASESIRFSPLLCPTAKAREKIIQSVFLGELFCRIYDPAVIAKHKSGFFTVLA